MLSGGELDWPIRTLIQLECQNAKAADMETCKRETAQYVEGEYGLLCKAAFARNKKLEKECRTTLGQTLWNDLEDLKEKLDERLKPVISRMLPGDYSAFDLVRNEAQAYSQRNKPAPPPSTEGTEQQEETEVPIVWSKKLAGLDDVVTGSKFQFTHVQEWRPVETEIKWFYWLEPNKDGTYTLFWRTDNEEAADPTPKDPKITFRLVDGEYPESLTLQFKEDHSVGIVVKDK